MIGPVEEVGHLVRALFQFHHEEEGGKLQEELSSLLKLLEGSVHEIWLEEQGDNSLGAAMAGLV